MSKRTEQYLSHAENRIHICRANALLWSAKAAAEAIPQYHAYDVLAEDARKAVYKWIGIAQEQHQEDHF